jgi:type II secretory pathway component PulK
MYYTHHGAATGLERAFAGEERGNTLVFALLALAVATILVAPLLAHVASGFETTESSRETVGVQYSADAGVEYAL